MKFILIVLILIASLGALSTCEGLDFHYKKTTKDSDKPTSDSSPSSTTVPENPSPTAAPESPSSPATPPPPPTPDPNNPNNPSPQPTPDPNNPNNPSPQPTPQPTPDPNNPNNPSPQPTPDPNNPNNPPPTNPNPNNPNPTTSLPGSEPTTAPAPAPPNTPPNKSEFPTVLASAKVTSDVAPPVPLKNGKMTGLLIFYQPSDGKTSITGYLNNLLDDVEGKYTFKIVNAKGTVINDLTGMINPIFQLGGSSTFSTIQDSVRLSGDPATNALGSFFVITQRDVAICKALIGEEFVIGG